MGKLGQGKRTQFGPPGSMKVALDALGDNGGSGTIASTGILHENHGLILRSGFAALAAIDASSCRRR